MCASMVVGRRGLTSGVATASGLGPLPELTPGPMTDDSFDTPCCSRAGSGFAGSVSACSLRSALTVVLFVRICRGLDGVGVFAPGELE